MERHGWRAAYAAINAVYERIAGAPARLSEVAPSRGGIVARPKKLGHAR
jgi:hypothetical protein